MGQRRKPEVAHERTAEREMREQEVLRANRELAAYFKGRRTEREARAALKIIKAFVRDRERRGARGFPPGPRADVATTPKKVANRKAASAGRERRRKPHRKSQERASKGVTEPKSPQWRGSDEPTPE